MQDHDLDELLRRSAVFPSPAATAAATELAGLTRAQADAPTVNSRPFERHRWLRRPMLAGGLLAGVVALSAGTTLAAYQMSIPPFQTLEAGVQRVDVPIPIDYQRSDGASIRCQVFMEFENLNPAELQRLDDAVTNQDWSPEQQRQLVGRPAAAGVPRSEYDVFTKALPTHLYKFAADVVPGLLDHHDGGKAAFNGYGASCRAVQK